MRFLKGGKRIKMEFDFLPRWLLPMISNSAGTLHGLVVLQKCWFNNF